MDGRAIHRPHDRGSDAHSHRHAGCLRAHRRERSHSSWSTPRTAADEGRRRPSPSRRRSHPNRSSTPGGPQMTTRQRGWTGHVFIATSVDGYIARSDGDLDWLTDAPPNQRHVPADHGTDAPPDYETFTAGVSHLVMGRGTYEKVLTFHPWPYDRFSVVVISTRLHPGHDDRISVVSTIGEACSFLEEEQATSVYVDGGEVVSGFLGEGLIDELTICRARYSSALPADPVPGTDTNPSRHRRARPKPDRDRHLLVDRRPAGTAFHRTDARHPAPMAAPLACSRPRLPLPARRGRIR